MPSITLLLQHLGLAMRLAATHPQLEPADVAAHVEAASLAATPQISPELLLAVAFVESRFSPFALSRIEGTERRIGRYSSDQPPPRLRKGTSMYCGPLQTFALTWGDCLAVRDLTLAYATGAKELTDWLNDRRVRGDMTLALAGYGCGNRGVLTGKCNRYPGRVLWQAKRLEIANPLQVLAPRS